MHGVVLSVEYLDVGTDSFEINCFDQSVRQWRQLARVEKIDSGRWKTISLLDSAWCRSPRNGGEDDHVDLVIDDLGDGGEHVAAAELAFVPARGWARDTVQAALPAAGHRVVGSGLSRIIELEPGETLNSVEVPLWVGSLEANRVRGRVIALTTDGESLASEKNYDYPADGDWFPLPVVPVPGCHRYRVELYDTLGSVAWYQSPDGSLAFRACQYRADPSQAGILKQEVTSSQNPQGSVSFVARRPFFGIQFRPELTPGSLSSRVALHRQLTDGRWSACLAEHRLSAEGSDQSPATLFVEPQTAGRYELRLSSKAAWVSTAPRILERVEILYLQPLQSAPPASAAPPPPGSRVIHDPHHACGVIEGGFDELPGNRQGRRFASAGSGGAITWSLESPVKASSDDVLHLSLCNATGAPLLRLSWAGDEEVLEAERSVMVPLVQHDTELRDYPFPVGLEPAWQGEVRQIRLEWLALASGAGHIDLGTLWLDAIRRGSAPGDRNGSGGGGE
jgi:hypothetical protein